jgi:cytoplasmic iron level regulating protein YaaA (DUF328/UPF0246 family)
VPSPRILLLLPPSEGKSPGGTGARWDVSAGVFGQRLAGPRRAVAGALLRAMADDSFDASHALGVRGPALLAGRSAARAVLRSPTTSALQRYTGVLYDAFGAAGLPAATRRRSEQDVAIVSGLAGLLVGGDAVPDYKLPIGASLPGVGPLASYWRPHVGPALDQWTEGAVVWDLLPGAHAAVWSPAASWRRRFVVKVLREAPDGRRSTVSHDNKSVKGQLAREVLRHRVRDVAGLRAWADAHGLLLEQQGDLVLVVRRG